jgi:biotin carboxyl carrier protein
MRTYFIDNDKNEHVIDLTRTTVHSSDLVEFKFSYLEEQKLTKEQNVFVRKLAGQYFVSLDNKRWNKLARQDAPTIMLNVDQVYDVFRGYKPSGLSDGDEGGLKTQMPGKVIKIPVAVGTEVKKGETVIVLEAMKMENEIKASYDGTVKEIYVKEGQALDNGVLMMELEKK